MTEEWDPFRPIPGDPMTTSPLRRRCTGESFDHAPAFFSIAVAHELLRCPICGFEVELGGVDGAE